MFVQLVIGFSTGCTTFWRRTTQAKPMTHPRFTFRLALLASFVLLVWGPPSISAQDLIFDEEDVEELDSQLIFEETDLIDSEDADLPLTTGLIIPGEAIDSATAEFLSDVLLDVLDTTGEAAVVDNFDLRDEFEIMGAELAMECALDPVCLGRVGYDVGLDRVVIGRAGTAREASEVVLTLDLIDTESRSVLRYRSVQVENNRDDLADEVERQVPYLYDIRATNGGTVVGPTGPSTFQVVASWATLGLGVTSLGLCIYFGLDASSLEDEVISGDLRGEDVYMMSQVDAQAKIDEASDSATLSNVFLGTGLALVGVSALLFLITPGSDIDVEAEGISRSGDWVPDLTPTVSGNGFGIQGSFSF